MASTTLVGLDIPAGQKVLAALEEDGVHIAVALWAKVAEYDEWRLFVASPDFDLGSKLEAHARAAVAVQPKFTWSAPNMVILRMNDPMVVALRKTYGMSASVDGMRLGGQTIGNRYIEDAYVFVIR